MKNIFDNLDYGKKNLAMVQLQATLGDKKSNKSKGQIIRRLRQEGFSLQKALSLHKIVSENQFMVEIIIKRLNQEIEKIKVEHKAEIETAKQQKQIQEWTKIRDAEKKELEANAKAVQSGLDIIFGEIVGIFY